MKRVYAHYLSWEDYQNGMYVGVPAEDDFLVGHAVVLLSDPEACFKWMRRVVRRWPIAASVNLSHRGRNRRAWLGQAACCLYARVPEHLTKQAWHRLTEEQQERANGAADRVIKLWERNYAENRSGD